MFLPISLRPWLDSVTVTDPEGHAHPLVRSERHVVESDRFPVPATPADWRLRYLAMGTILGLVMAGLGRSAGRSARGRVAFGVVATGWAFLTGLAGVALAGLWAFTRHDFSYRNENLFQLNLISLALAAVLPRALGSGGRRYRLAVGLALSVVVLGALGLVLKFLPGFYQDNLTIVALIFPIHLGLLAGLLAAGARTG